MISTDVINDTAASTSPKADCVAWVKIVKLMIKVAPEAMNLQLIAFRILLVGLSLSVNLSLLCVDI